jgi:hypothetical protein
MRLVYLLLGLLFTCAVFAEEEKKPEPEPLDPMYHGVHPMALVNKGSNIFAVNMSGYRVPHDLQIVYQIKNPDVAFLNLVKDAELVTIKPQAFNIQRLLRGEEITVTADVYMGHFDRGGSLFYANRTIEFTDKLYAREFKELQDSTQWQEYDYVDIKGSERLYIHKIQKAPSFSHLIHIDMTGACLQKFRTSKRVPKESELTYKFVNCGTLKPLYYEAEDFQEK